jgi:GTP-binding protein Era
MMTKSAILSVCGRPNVCKSTLINALVGEKISIVSDKPQTTRNRITAVVDHGETQFIMMDMPGFHKPKNKLGQYMANVINNTAFDVDCIILVAEPTEIIDSGEAELIRKIQASGLPCILALNKIDLIDKKDLLSVIARYSSVYPFDAVVPLSAKTGDGLAILLDEMERFADESPHLFPDDMITDQPEKQICAEMIREKILQCLDKEIPHGIAVEISRFKERESGMVDLEAVIYCEKSSHKGIIIGKNGSMLKKIGSLARADIEHLLSCRVNLQTWVKVKENWRDSDILLSNFGFTED